jgi:type III pantothenate kinase
VQGEAGGALMLLAIDVGNTQTVFGLFDDERLTEQFRVGTDPTHTGDELAVMLRAFVDLDALDGIVLSSTVPPLVREYEAFAERWAETELLVLGPGVATGVPVRYDNPREVGPDRIANAVAALARYGAPAVVVDFGTSTNFDVVSRDGEYVGGVLAPGIEVSMDALFARAARLTKVPFEAPDRVIGKSTTSALQSGLVYGFAGQVDAIADRIRAELAAPDAPVIATGGLADLITPHARTITHVDPHLTLEGLRVVWARNLERA